MTNFKAYLPLHALRKMDLESILSIAAPKKLDDDTKRKVDYHNSRRTMLYYLLSMQVRNKDKLEQLFQQHKLTVNWQQITSEYNKLKEVTEPYKIYNNAVKYDDYWELKKTSNVRFGAKQSREYISKYRKEGFQLNELKIYWNYDEICCLNEDDKFNPETDTDTNQALKQYPVNERHNSVQIKFVKSGIEQAVFDIPADQQIIVLDFADERMPGGYFLENARTQEEVILYNSDGYRALLDLKYQKMDGGYMLPKFGVAYVKNVKFFLQRNGLEERTADLILGACFDLSGVGEGLYKPPSHAKKEELEQYTYEKFKSIIASAVANTEGNGDKTYLLLGPIGTGAFSNDMKMIARLFAKVLNENLMTASGPIKQAFKEIWFVSTDGLVEFQMEFKEQ